MKQLLIALILLPIYSHAFTITNQYITSGKEQINDEQWIIATVATPDGLFLNDISIICANPLIFSGTYEGNVNGIGGMETHLEGIAKRNVRIAGKIARIDGSISGNLSVIADTVTISKKAKIGGNVRVIADKAIIEGSILGNLDVMTGNLLTLDGNVGKNAQLKSREIIVANNLNVLGDFNYLADEPLIINSKQVGGNIYKIEDSIAISPLSPAKLKSRGIWLFAAFLSGILYLLIFTNQAHQALHYMYSSPLKCILIGFLASGVTPLIGVFCLTSLIGIPTGIFTIGLWGAWVYLSKIITACLVGIFVLKLMGMEKGRFLLASAIGLLLLSLIGLIPGLEIPIQAVSLWLGMGAILQTIFLKRSNIIMIEKEKNMQKA